MNLKPIHLKGLEYYHVSDCGKVYNSKKNTFRKPSFDGAGYQQVNFMYKLKKINVKIHRLVAIAFIPNTTGYNVINHKDGVKTNNNASNLEWCSHSQNRLHSARVLGNTFNKHLFKKGNTSNNIKCEVIKGPKPGIYNSFTEAGKANGTSGAYLSQIIRKNVKSTVFIVRKIDT